MPVIFFITHHFHFYKYERLRSLLCIPQTSNISWFLLFSIKCCIVNHGVWLGGYCVGKWNFIQICTFTIYRKVKLTFLYWFSSWLRYGPSLLRDFMAFLSLIMLKCDLKIGWNFFVFASSATFIFIIWYSIPYAVEMIS